MLCPYCNTELDADTQFCTSCGKDVSENTGTAASDETKTSDVKIKISHDAKEADFADMTELLIKALNDSGAFSAEKMSKAEWETESVKHELLDTGKDIPFIFVGKFDDALFNACQWKYDELGMKYGWNENKALLFIEKRKWNEKELKELTELFGQTAEPKPANFLKKGLDAAMGGFDKLPKWGKVATAAAGGFLFGLGALAIAGGTYFVNGAINNAKVFENQKKYLIKKFISEGLGEFLSGV
ncbi:hypothetical protein AGMMS49579_09240 [Spirochaetia bacterium]|nr:hypothetical protein AGMMS49579_09240 [Spirochaetia bacterium]